MNLLETIKAVERRVSGSSVEFKALNQEYLKNGSRIELSLLLRATYLRWQCKVCLN